MRILLVEDSPTDARLLQADLGLAAAGGDFEVTWVERLGDAVAKVIGLPFDVVLLDLTLPDSAGITSFLRMREAAPHIPIVVLTGLDDEAAGAEAIRRGVQDYLVKGQVDGKTIARAIRYAVERKFADETLRRVNAELEQRVSEIQIANKNLQESRRAALNLMEDALHARRELEQSAAELKKSREDLNRAQAVARTGSWRIDIWNNALTWSDENYRIFRVPASTVLSYESFLAAVHPDDRELVDKKWNSALGGEPYDIEHRIIAGGEVRWVRDTAFMEYDEKGILRSGFGTTQDITERKWMETELAEKSAQLEKLVSMQTREIIDTRESLDTETRERMRVEDELTHRQLALEAVYSMATAFETSFTAMNDQVVMGIAKILEVPFAAIHYITENGTHTTSRYTRGALSYETVGDISQCIACMNNPAFRNDPWKNRDMKDFYRCTGCFPEETIKGYSGAPIMSNHGEILGLVCALDSVERTFDEDDVRLIEIFARYLAHEQMQRQLESQLIRSNEMRMLGQLTSGVAHEVRNPLNGIMAIMSALSKELSDIERFKPFLHHMQTQVSRLTVLMEDLLALGRPVREEKKGDIVIAALAEKALAVWRQSAKEEHEALVFDVEKACRECMVHVDGSKIEQAIVNLLDNAQQHSGPGDPILLSVETRGPSVVRITVKDTGPGIPKEILPQIFEPFFTTRKGGTGLGLSIVRHIVESHGGSITAHNNADGYGATFIIDLPMAK